MANGATEMPKESPLGQSYVGLTGIIVVIAYLVLISVTAFYVVVKIWPPDPLPGVMTSTNPGNPPATRPESTTTQVTPIKWPVTFFWCSSDTAKTDCWISLNTALFLIVMLSGALGSLLHSFRSLYWYVGNRKLVWSWTLMYMLLPFSGAVLATVFYIIIRAGFLPSSGGTQSIPNTPYGFAALGALVGLFSEQAVMKLKQVAETIFTGAQAGKDHAAPPPKVTSVLPKSGAVAGGTTVTITGADFSAGAKVNFGGTPATSVGPITATSISAVTPPHVGHVDVEVINVDGQKSTLTGAFEYI